MGDDKQATAGKLEVSARGDLEIVGVRVFDAPRELVYRAFTEADLVARWWGSREGTTIIDKFDPRPGGAWRIVDRDKDGNEDAFRGEIRELTPPERVVQTFEWEGLPGHVSVETVTLEDIGGGQTKVTSVSTFDNPEDRDGMLSSGMETGMAEAYDQLAELLGELGSN
jgi:uncharacterized protein YndB with AHSA1/START domain